MLLSIFNYIRYFTLEIRDCIVSRSNNYEYHIYRLHDFIGNDITIDIIDSTRIYIVSIV